MRRCRRRVLALHRASGIGSQFERIDGYNLYLRPVVARAEYDPALSTAHHGSWRSRIASSAFVCDEKPLCGPGWAVEWAHHRRGDWYEGAGHMNSAYRRQLTALVARARRQRVW